MSAISIPELAPFFEVGDGATGDEFRSLKLGELLAFCKRFGKSLAVESVEFWFWIEGINMRRAARHAEMDYAFRFRREMEAALLVEIGRFPAAGGSGKL